MTAGGPNCICGVTTVYSKSGADCTKRFRSIGRGSEAIGHVICGTSRAWGCSSSNNRGRSPCFSSPTRTKPTRHRPGPTRPDHLKRLAISAIDVSVIGGQQLEASGLA